MRSRFVASIITALLVVGSAAAAAQAAPAPESDLAKGTIMHEVVHNDGSESKSAAEQIKDLERLQDTAIPVEDILDNMDYAKTKANSIDQEYVELPVDDRIQKKFEEDPGFFSSSNPESPFNPENGRNSSFAPSSNYVATVGKVFVTIPDSGPNGEDQSGTCSASAVDTPSQRIVATAGHCVHSGTANGVFFEDWRYIPGFTGKDFLSGDGAEIAPFGIFYAQHFFAEPDWLNHGESEIGYSSDVAFVTTGKSWRAENVVEASGGHQVDFTSQADFDADVFGYPRNFYFKQMRTSCTGQTSTPLLNYTLAGCHMSKGASGGPWLTQYDPNTGHGLLRSVSSSRHLGEPTPDCEPLVVDATDCGRIDLTNSVVNGPIFDGETVRALSHAEHADY